MAPQTFTHRVEKPWGYEVIYTPAELARTGKVLFIKKGGQLSLQYHEKKEETLCLFSGKATLQFGSKIEELADIDMKQWLGYTVKPGDIHRLIAVEDSYVLEVSSPEEGTTVRLQDSYGRKNETEKDRDKDRGLAA